MWSDDRSGFTLLETLISLLFLAGVVSAVSLHFFSSRRAMRRSSEMGIVLNEAEALLNRVGLDIPLREGVWSGNSSNGLQWTLTISPYQSDGRNIPYLLDIQVRAEMASVTNVNLSTLRRLR